MCSASGCRRPYHPHSTNVANIRAEMKAARGASWVAWWNVPVVDVPASPPLPVGAPGPDDQILGCRQHGAVRRADRESADLVSAVALLLDLGDLQSQPITASAGLGLPCLLDRRPPPGDVHLRRIRFRI